MTAPRSKSSLAAEFATWTEEMSNGVMSDLVKAALARPAKISRDFDIPYIAGDSVDGRTIYIERHLPRSFTFRARRVESERFVALHEIIEKALLDELRLHCLHAHQIAPGAVQAAVRAAGVAWRASDRFTKSNSAKIEKEHLKKVPSNLDLTPYRDEDDFDTLQRLERRAK